jgi:anti-sigma B factor antagonist
MNLVRTDGLEATRAVFAVSGELDLHTAEQFRRDLLRAMDTLGHDLTVDMSGVSFMDCSGLNVLAFAFREATAHGGRLTVTGLSEIITRMLGLFGFQSAIDATVRSA